MIAVKNPGSARTYNVIDETSGEILETISLRQYDKRFGVLAKEGFNSYEAREKALDYKVEGPFKFAKTKHHIYDLGLPTNLYNAINKVIESSPQFGTKMTLSLEVEVYGDRKPYKRWFGGKVQKKASFMIKKMIDELFDAVASDYDIEYVILGHTLTLIDRSE